MKNLRVIKDFTKLIYKIRPIYFFLIIFKTILDAANILINIFIPKIIIDLLIKDINMSKIVKTILIISILKYIVLYLSKLLKGKIDIYSELLNKEIIYEFSRKSLKLEYMNLEDPYILDLRERALFAVNDYGALYSLFNYLEIMLVQIFIILGVGGILLSLSKIYILVVIFFVYISYKLNKVTKEKIFDYTQEVIPINRKYNYYLDEILSDRNQKDFRIYNMSNMMSQTIENLTYETTDWLNSLYILEGKARILQSLIGYLLTFISYGYISLRVFTNTYGDQIGISNFIMYINSTEKFFNSFSELVNSVTEIKHVANYLQPFHEFMKLEENEDIFGDIKVKDFDSIEFRNVTFTYPKSDKKTLDNISFKINKGEKISIVGINNAGKTTIIKLLCAFFKPDEGEILLNGLDIRKYDYESYIDTIAVVFQDYKLFPFTINENITTDKKSTKTVEDVLKKVDLDNVIDKLEKKSDSYLDKNIYEDAVDLSGGEKQKIAIARALYKDAKLIILDEPTAALDPISESEIYENFNELVKEKTAIYISHRMSSSKFCDKILLLDEGKIKDFDTHDNLMKKDSIYKKLFNAQADNFK